MTTSATKVSSAVDVTDESFDAGKAGDYHLSILLENEFHAFAVLDKKSNKYLLLRKTVTKTGALDFSSITSLTKSTNWGSISLSIANSKFSLIPTPLFDDSSKQSLLGFNHIIDEDEKIHSDKLKNTETRNVFTISRKLEAEIRKEFPTALIIHCATALIDGILFQNKNHFLENPKKNTEMVFANFYHTFFEVVIFKAGQLVYNNAFQYKSAEDIAYYILFIYEQLHLNPEEIELIVSGEIEKIAEEHSLLYNYIRHITFASLPDAFKYSYKFDDIQKHTYFSLLNQYLCV